MINYKINIAPDFISLSLDFVFLFNGFHKYLDAFLSGKLSLIYIVSLKSLDEFTNTLIALAFKMSCVKPSSKARKCFIATDISQN